MVSLMVDKLPAKKRKQCGTTSGHRQHVKRGEQQCDSCRAAMNAYQRERRAALKSGERKLRVSRKSEAARVEREAAQEVAAQDLRLDGYPIYLNKAGRRLWDAMQGQFEITDVAEPIAVEICRMKDRLDTCAAALSSKNTLWFQLGDPEELASGETQVQVVVNNLLGEARGTANTLAQLMKKLEVLAPAKSKGDAVDPLAELMREMESAANGG